MKQLSPSYFFSFLPSNQLSCRHFYSVNHNSVTKTSGYGRKLGYKHAFILIKMSVLIWFLLLLVPLKWVIVCKLGMITSFRSGLPCAELLSKFSCLCSCQCNVLILMTIRKFIIIKMKKCNIGSMSDWRFYTVEFKSLNQCWKGILMGHWVPNSF